MPQVKCGFLAATMASMVVAGSQPMGKDTTFDYLPSIRGRNAQSSKPASPVRGPIHSWETVPVSFHGCRPNTRGPTGLEFLADDLAALKRYPLITLEKWQGTRAFSTDVDLQHHPHSSCVTRTDPCDVGRMSAPETNVFYWEEDAWVSAAKQIKEVNPNASIAVWMDTMLIYTGWSWPPPSKYTDENINRTLNPDINIPCSGGYFRPSEFLEQNPSYLLMNSSGLPALESWAHCHVYDHTKDYVREYWKEMCLNFTATGLIDGCGADFSALEKNHWSRHNTDYIQKSLALDFEIAKAWNEGHKQMMREMTSSLQQEGGYFIGKNWPELGDHVNAVLEEGCPPRNDTIVMLQNLTATAQKLRQRLIYQCHTFHLDESTLAVFLCGAGPDHYIAIGGWNWDHSGFPGHWDPSFEKPLGEPLGAAAYDAETTVWTRTFASGTVASFNATSNIGRVDWASDGVSGEEQKVRYTATN